MATLPQSPPAGKSTPLRLTDHPCPCCRRPSSAGTSPSTSPRWRSTGVRAAGVPCTWSGLPCRGWRMREPLLVPALDVLASLEASLHFALGLPVDGGRVAVPQQWLKDWRVQAQITLELLAPEGPQRKGERL